MKKVKCESCGVDFPKRDYELKKTKHNYCSEKCAIKGKTKPLKCRYCGSSDLVQNKNSSTGHRRICKKCMILSVRKIQRKYIQSNRCIRCGNNAKANCILCQKCLTKDANRQAEKRRANKRKAVKLLGEKCERCGVKSEIMAIYDFHHPDKDKETTIALISNKSFERIKKELLKCKLLCANCHRIIHGEERNYG